MSETRHTDEKHPQLAASLLSLSLISSHSLFLLWPFASLVVRPFRLLFVSRQAGTTGAALYVSLFPSVCLPANILSKASFAVCSLPTALWPLDCSISISISSNIMVGCISWLASFAATSTISLMHLTWLSLSFSLCPGAAAALSPVAAAIIRCWLREAFAYHSSLPVLADRLSCCHLAALLLLSLSSLPKWHALSICLSRQPFLIAAPLYSDCFSEWKSATINWLLRQNGTVAEEKVVVAPLPVGV